MSIFDNYENLNTDYIPNNQERKFEGPRTVYQDGPPYLYFNKDNNVIGYCWNTGDTFVFNYSATRKIHIEKDAILYTEAGQAPDQDTSGFYLQRAYNIADLKCWMCTSYDSMIYDWDEESFNYPNEGRELEINFTSTNDLSIEFDIKNFRGETIYTKTFDTVPNAAIDINSELALLLKAGVWRFEFSLVKENYKLFTDAFLIFITDDPIEKVIIPSHYID